jgi:hypothetical protein
MNRQLKRQLHLSDCLIQGAWVLKPFVRGRLKRCVCVCVLVAELDLGLVLHLLLCVSVSEEACQCFSVGCRGDVRVRAS